MKKRRKNKRKELKEKGKEKGEKQGKNYAVIGPILAFPYFLSIFSFVLSSFFHFSPKHESFNFPQGIFWKMYTPAFLLKGNLLALTTSQRTGVSKLFSHIYKKGQKHDSDFIFTQP